MTVSSTNRIGTTEPSVDSPPRRFADRYRLTGRSRTYDPRVTAARRDIADIALADRLFAPHYVRALPRLCGNRAAMLHAAGDANARAVSQLLPGEAFAVLDMGDDWCWGYCIADNYVGYVRTTALVTAAGQPTHVVIAPRSLLFAKADIKSPSPRALPIGSRVSGRIESTFLALNNGGFLPAGHVAPIDTQASDPVGIACSLIGTPYLWGGRGGNGIDCSGLVQLSLALCGIAAPRDSDQQQAELGLTLAPDAPAKRGDLVFFPGHVGMMVDADLIVHANGHAMAVVVEPLADVVARMADDRPDPILLRRRLP